VPLLAGVLVKDASDGTTIGDAVSVVVAGCGGGFSDNGGNSSIGGVNFGTGTGAGAIGCGVPNAGAGYIMGGCIGCITPGMA
jgi:hypothetical protein